MSKYSAVLAKEFPFANKLNAMSRQASAERAWAAISRFFDSCKKKVVGKKGFPQFQKDNRSIEYKTQSWKLADDRKSITFTDKNGIGRLKMKGTQFRVWLEYFGKVFKRITIAVNPAYTSQECSSCGVIVKKSLSTRTHVCQCGCKLDRDHNAGINILNSGLGTIGHIGTSVLDTGNASGESTSILVGENLLG